MVTVMAGPGCWVPPPEAPGIRVVLGSPTLPTRQQIRAAAQMATNSSAMQNPARLMLKLAITFQNAPDDHHIRPPPST